MTTVNPMLRVKHNGNYAAGFLDAGGISETYVHNTGLNFLGSNGSLFLNLDNTIRRIIPNATLLITDAVSYVPVPPGFVNPVAGTSPGDPTNVQDIFSQGIIFFRSNRVSNNGTVTTSYATSASTRVTASYNHSTLRFLSDSVNLFNTTTHTGTLGGTAQLSENNQLNVRYSIAHSEFDSRTGPSFLFKTHTATVGWSRVLSRSFKAEVSGGGLFIDPGLTTYAANVALIMNVANTQATLSYARAAFPGFAGAPTQVVGDVASLSAVQEISPHWQLTGAANYSHSSGASPTSEIKFDTYGGSVNLAYLITRIWSVGLGYSYLRFNQEFEMTQFEFDRHVGMFSVRATWE